MGKKWVAKQPESGLGEEENGMWHQDSPPTIQPEDSNWNTGITSAVTAG